MSDINRREGEVAGTALCNGGLDMESDAKRYQNGARYSVFMRDVIMKVMRCM